jgi:Phage tail sheath protein subtilisin-like domain/Phage tail sheath C-terminal domain
MAEKIVSPGVFTNEKDLSFLPAGIAAIGAAIIGPTLKGPAFVPTVITNFNDFIAKFGGLSEETYVPYTVKSYLNAASTVTVVRVLQEGGYNADSFQILATTGSVTSLVGVIMPTTTVGSSTGKGYTKSIIPAGTLSISGSYGITLSGSGVTGQAITASVDPTNVSSFYNVLGTSVKGSKKGYMYVWFSDYLTTIKANAATTISFVSASANALVNLSGSAGAYSQASTPWIQSQIIGSEKLNLFKVHTLAAGTDTNTSVKVSVINGVLPGNDPGSDYGNFTIVVRDYKDTDQRPIILETYSGLNLDPDSSNYIARRIGNKAYSVSSAGVVSISGDYDNVSKYIRVEVDSAVSSKSVTANVKPFGFAAVNQPVSSSYTFPTASVVSQLTQINGAYNKKAYYGWDFSVNDNENYLKPLASGVTTNGSAFNLDECFVHPSASVANSNSSIASGRSISGSTFEGLDVSTFLKFSLPFQGGFDGMDPAITKNVGSSITATNVFGMNCSTAASAGSVGYIKALNVISNSDEYDINMIVTPGITIANHSSIINKAIEVAEDRGDAFVVADPVIQGSSADTAVAAVSDSGIDSNYIATYWPWVKILDTDKNKPVWVPPSVVLPRVMAYNDSVAYEWFAPAGLNRGGISEAVDIELKLNQATRNDLYENKINAIATFPNQGVCVWGQKTLQAKPSALDRINVRRLLITLKKFIASSSRYLVFENNTTATRQRFLNIVTPYLETVKARQGLYAFRVVMDETNNTPDVIDRNIMYGQIYLQPAKAAEFIILDFNILPTGATFENA